MNVNVQRSLQPLRIRYADPLLGRLRSFWRWWSAELIELLPENLQKAHIDRPFEQCGEPAGTVLTVC